MPSAGGLASRFNSIPINALEMPLSNDAIKELQNYLEIQGLAWAREFIDGRKKWMAAKGIRVSSELINSLQEEVSSTLDTAARTRIEIAFKEYGRFLDMKNLKAPAGGAEYIGALEQWIEQKGLRTRFTNRLMQQRGLRTAPANILNQLAWSVAISRHTRAKRRRQWYNKPKSAAITELYNRVAANLPELVAQEIKNAFNKN